MQLTPPVNISCPGVLAVLNPALRTVVELANSGDSGERNAKENANCEEYHNYVAQHKRTRFTTVTVTCVTGWLSDVEQQHDPYNRDLQEAASIEENARKKMSWKKYPSMKRAWNDHVIVVQSKTHWGRGGDIVTVCKVLHKRVWCRDRTRITDNL